ncbi:hypothetical protein N9X92_05705, partial [Gammaproteobacteria bacterium]|nr:hypothetical protein [Gammaproteobacteria bacterium]
DPSPEAQVFALTTGVNSGAAFTGTSADDSFVAGDVAGSQTFTSGDSIDGGAGTDTLTLNSASAISVPVSSSVSNMNVVTVTGSSTVSLNTSTWGVDTLTVTAADDTSITAASTTDVTISASALTNAAGNELSVAGGKDVTVTTADSMDLDETAPSNIVVGGATTGASGAVSVTHTETFTDGAGGVGAADTATGSNITVTGGTSISVSTQATAGDVADNAGDVFTVGAVTITGDANTTSASITSRAEVTNGGAAGAIGITAGTHTIDDKNAASTTAAGTISTVTLATAGDVTIDSSAISTLNLSGTTGTTNIGRGALTAGPSGTSLDLNLTAGTTSTSVGVITDDEAAANTFGFRTINVSATPGATAAGVATTNTVADLIAVDATTLNVSGSGSLTFTLADVVRNATAVNVTSTGTTDLSGDTLNTAATFAGGDGVEKITVGATTKAISMGAGNDTVTVGVTALGAGGSIDGGDGDADTIALATADVSSSTGVTATGSFESSVSGFERLSITDSAATDAVNLANLDDINYITTAGSAGTLTLNNVSSGVQVVTTAAATGTTVALADITATDDVVGFTISGSAQVAAGTLTANGVETLSLSADDTTTPDGTVTHTVTISANAATTVNVSGDADLAITGTGTTFTSINASGQTNGFAGVAWAAIGSLASAATITGGAGADNFGGTTNTATKALTMDGGAGEDTLKGGAGNDTITDTSIETDLDGNSLDGNGGNDTITGGAGEDTITAGAGNDSIDAGAGNDSITLTSGVNVAEGGAGDDTIVAGTGNDTITDSAGDDTYTLSTNWNSTDSITDLSGTDSATVDARSGTDITGGATSGIESFTATFDAASGTVGLANVEGSYLVVLDNDGNASTDVAVSGVSSGSTVRNIHADNDGITVDTAANATLTYDARAASGTSTTFTDVANLTITNGSSTAGDLGSTVLDATDTTVLTVTTGTTSDLDIGAVTNADSLTSITLTAQTDGQDLTVASVDDIDSLTSLTVSAVNGDISLTADLGSTTAGEEGSLLSTISLTATSADITLGGTIYGDTNTDGVVGDASAADLAMTVSAAASFGSTIDAGSIDNQYGTITFASTGAGTADSTLIYADDVTASLDAGGTHVSINAVDDAVITASNSNDVAITTLTTGTASTGVASVTVDGSGAFEITNLAASAGTFTLDGSSATGAITLGTNSRTGKMTIEGGSGNDSLEGGTGIDSLVGGTGDDELVGAGGNDILSGGEGNDTLDVSGAAGIVDIDGGAGNDTLTLGAFLGSTDVIDGGDGTDTATFTVASSVINALTAVEAATVTFNLGGAFNANSAASLDTVNLIAGTSTHGIVVNLPTGVTVNNTASAEAETLTLDTVDGATLTVNALETATNALTITDAATVTLSATQTSAAAAGYGSVVLDASATNALTVTGGNKAAMSTGAVTGTTSLTSIAATTSTAAGDVTIGALATITSLTSLSLTSSLGDLTISTGADMGGTAAGNALSTINITATNSSTIDLSDGQEVTMDTTDSVSDLAATVTVSVDATSTANVGDLENTYGTITVNATNNNTLTFDSLGAEDVTVTVDGTGTTTISQIDTKTGTGDDVTITASGSGDLVVSDLDATDDVTINFASMTSGGTVDITLDDIAGAISITGGAAALTLTTADDTDGVDSQSIVLGSNNGVIDAITTNATDTAAFSVTGLETTDTIDVSVAGANAAIADTLATLDGATTSLGTVTVSIQEISGAYASFGTDSTKNVVALDGDFALASQVVDAIETGGSMEITLDVGNTGFTAGTDAFLVLWDDGANSYLGAYTGTAAAAGANTFTAGAGSITTLITFVGIDDATDVSAAMLGTTFI